MQNINAQVVAVRFAQVVIGYKWVYVQNVVKNHNILLITFCHEIIITTSILHVKKSINYN